jgi:subtilisin-like proprotein convertase family protein/subtilisin family serine protease
VSRIASLAIAAALLAGMTGAVLATAQSQPQQPDVRPHLLLVPADAEGTAALARTDARVLARYESFSLVEAKGGDDERLRGAGAERRDDMRTVETAAGEIDPRSERSSLAAKEAPDRQETLALVQFVGPPKEAWLERLRRTGVRVLTYQAQNAYVVHAQGEAVGRLAAVVGTDPVVRAVSVLTATDKVERVSRPWGRWAVTTVAGAVGADVRNDAAQAGLAVGAPSTVGALRTQYLALSADEVEDLALDPSVVAIEPDREPELLDERAAQIVAGNLDPPGFTLPGGAGYLGWLVDPSRIPDQTTFDDTIDVTDTGLDGGIDPPAHPDFREQGSASNDDRVSYVNNHTGETPSDCSGHGTNTASIATGYNTSGGSDFRDGEGFNHGLGVAPFARVGVSKIFPSCGAQFAQPNYGNVAAEAHLDGAVISNNSWGEGNNDSWGTYSSRSRLYDRLVRDARPSDSAFPLAGNQQMVEVFAAGNDGDDNPRFADEGYGTISAEGSAKNVITVGASESVRLSGTDGCGVTDAQANSARDIVNFSSRGPTDDGRLKPDLVAPGTHITGARPQHAGYIGNGVCNNFPGTTWYTVHSGTSQAAPQVSGAAALVRRWYRHTQLNDDPSLEGPSPALTKALLVNNATDLAGGDNGKGDTIAAGPNTDQGWGRVNLGNIFDSTTRRYRDQLPADILNDSGHTRVRAYSVPDPNRPIKVTLAWTDAPGPTSGDPVVNNLDLAVDAGGRTYKGNVFSGSTSRTGGTADARNNVESVYLPAGSATRIGVTVRGTSIAGDGVPGVGDDTDQDYALVVSNAQGLPPTPVLSGEAPQVTDADPGGDGDGALEPGESFGLRQGIWNGGSGTATGVQGTMSAPSPLSFTPVTRAYDPIAPRTSSTNSTPFDGQLAATATCGADVTATLSLDTDQGTQEVPVALPTGSAGSATPRSAVDVPLPIPDDSSTGATSSLNVAGAGLVKDVDVSISRITHGWVGDLTVQLTGPDGTTVTLADHPGGPDNDGDDFVNTVFDDEAQSNISSGTAPYAGSFRPQNDELSRFDGKNKQGTWTLRVRDLAEGETGILEEWGTITRKATCGPEGDVVNPVVSIDTPVAGSTTSDSTPQITGHAGTAPGDLPTVTVRIHRATGGLVQKINLDTAAGTWSTTAASLPDGAYVVRAEQSDSSGNAGVSAPVAFRVDVPEPPPPPPPLPPPPPPTPLPQTPTPPPAQAPSFVLAPAEERLADALAGRLRVIAACASACQLDAEVRVSSKASRSLGLGAKSTSLGTASKRVGRAGTVAAVVRFNTRARTAIRRTATTVATLHVTLATRGRTLVLRRAISLRRSAGLKRVVARGLRLWTGCSDRCTMSGRLTLSASGARRIGLKPGRSARMTVAAGEAIAPSGTTSLLALKVRPVARKAMSKARRVDALLEAVAGADPVTRTAKRGITLHR